MAKAGKLSHAAQVFVVTSLACYDRPKSVQDALKESYGVDISLQAIVQYDPTRNHGRKLKKAWKDLFDATRERFLADSAKVAVAQRAVRLRRIGAIVDRAEDRGNDVLALQALEQAAKDSGQFFEKANERGGLFDGAVFELRPPPTAAERAGRPVPGRTG